MTDERTVARVKKALCCPSGVCQSPEHLDYIKGTVGVCHANGYAREARAAIAAYEAAMKDAGYQIIPPVTGRVT